MTQVLTAEVNVLCILIIFILTLRTVRADRSSQQEALLCMYIFTMLFCASDIFWRAMDGQSVYGAKIVNYIANTVYFTFCMLSTYFAFCYSENVINAKWIRNRKCYFYVLIPALLVSVLAAVSCVTEWMFYIDENGFYRRGPLHFVQPVVCVAYFAAASIRALVKGKRASAYTERETDFTIASFGVIPVVGGILQLFFSDIPVLCPMLTLALVMVFINIQESYITQDSLTKLGNRYRLMSKLEEKMGKYKNAREGALYLIMMDIDRFKQINDEYGHVEGDRALIRVADAMKENCRDRGGYASRLGGDEFAIVLEAENEERVENMIREIRREIEENGKGEAYSVNVSAGFAKYNPDTMNISGLLAAADVQLYKDKQKKTR